jgi:hypothetical protein
MRMAIPAAILTITVSTSILATAASAQDRGAQDSNAAAAPARMAGAGETTGAGGASLAPIGHRQPTMNNLPGGVRDVETGRGRAFVDPFGPLPKICNDC